MKNPKVSIIIRTKNEERWISSCLRAIYDQTYNNFEIRNTSKGEIKNQRLNFVKIKKDLNWRPTISISSGLKKTIKWYKKI